MRVEMLREKTIRLDRINSRTFPRGWKGDVPVEILATFTEADFRLLEDLPIVPPGVNPATVLTADQVQFLAAFAEGSMQAISGRQDAGAGPEDLPDAVNENEDAPAPPADDLSAASVGELRGMAIGRGIVGASRMKKAELIAALQV